MLVKDLIKQLDKYKGKKIACPIYLSNNLHMPWVFVEKADFINSMKNIENSEIDAKWEEFDTFIQLILE